MLDQISSIFFEEANELLDNLENSLLSLEAEPENQEFIGAVFRAMHTIKGSAGMFGYTNISEFTHEMENAFDLVRNGGLPVTKDLINLTLTARDHIRTMLGTQSNPAQQAQSEKITKELHAYIAKYTNGNTTKLPTAETTSPASQPASGYIHPDNMVHYILSIPDDLEEWNETGASCQGIGRTGNCDSHCFYG